MLIIVIVLSSLSVSEDSRKRKVENIDLDSVTTKCRRALKLKPSVAPAPVKCPVPHRAAKFSRNVGKSSSNQECHFVPSCSLTLQTHPDLQDTSGPAAYLGLHSHLRACISQKLSKIGIQLFFNHGKDTRSPQKNTIHPFEALTQHRGPPTPQSRSM